MHPVIVHIDLDAFYAQVEHVRLSIPLDIPLAVQQWQGLIAVNYAARAHGIKRHSTMDEAKKLCPNLRLVHVATFGPNDSKPVYHEDPTPRTHKVSLDVYRTASTKIMEVIKRHVRKMQRASIDEAYLDITEEVAQRMEPIDAFDRVVDWTDAGIVLGDTDEPSSDASDLALRIGADIAAEIRGAILAELGYSSSAGIARNKTLAKICSALNKPGKQVSSPRCPRVAEPPKTILRDTAILPFLKDFPFANIRNLGGKFGNEVEDRLGVKTAGEIWAFPLDHLIREFGEERGRWVYNVSRGMCEEEVTEVKKVKSMGANKTLRPPVKTDEEFNRWLEVLASEVFFRLQQELADSNRWPKTITVRRQTPSQPTNPPSSPTHQIHCRTDTGKSLSKSTAMLPKEKILSFVDVALLASSLLCGQTIFPCSHLGITVSGLTELDASLQKLDAFLAERSILAEEKGKQSPTPRKMEKTDKRKTVKKTEMKESGTLLKYFKRAG
ncbi:DNA-directed DNA polymerase eta rad30 [Phlyctochytrium bullatum]|nr:DNA-directed DNA polymerase eta rad30 [Phlyctochytrium bullatum]